LARARRLVQRRGIACEEVIKISVAIIDENRAIDNLTGLGMPTPLLNKRRRILADLRQRLTTADATRRA
jgi:hypothetical protein